MSFRTLFFGHIAASKLSTTPDRSRRGSSASRIISASSLEGQSATPRAAAPEHKKILQLYVDRFNRQDWDGLRELISADARLLVADRYSGSFADGGYPGVYSRMRATWRLTLGEVDGELSILLFNLRNDSWELE